MRLIVRIVASRKINLPDFESSRTSVDKRFITKCPHPPLTPYRDSAGDMHRKYCEYILIFQEKSNIYLLMIFVVSFFMSICHTFRPSCGSSIHPVCTWLRRWNPYNRLSGEEKKP